MKRILFGGSVIFIGVLGIFFAFMIARQSSFVTYTFGQLIAYSIGNGAAATAASVANPFIYNFTSPGTLNEAGSMAESSSPYWWLNSGGEFIIANGNGMTIQGDLPKTDKWYSAYLLDNPVDTDNGLHPQNIFRLVTRSTWQNLRQEVYFKIVQDQLSASPNRNASNGVLLFNRYVDGQTLYYTGVRVDGAAVIKKKQSGTYYTMDYKAFTSGVYNHDTNPSLIPKNTWIGIRSEVVTNSNGTVTIKLYTDIGKTGTWTLAAQAVDDGKTYGTGIIADKAYAGIRTDFADVLFSGYRIEEVGTTQSTGTLGSTATSTVATSTQTTTSSGSSGTTVSSGGTVPVVTLPLDTTPPIITLFGLNPSQIQKGTTFIDLGASVTDNVDMNLGYHVFGSVDTSKVGTYTLSYVATDNAGNTSTTTRSVIVFDPAKPQTQATTTSSTGTTSTTTTSTTTPQGGTQTGNSSNTGTTTTTPVVQTSPSVPKSTTTSTPPTPPPVFVSNPTQTPAPHSSSLGGGGGGGPIIVTVPTVVPTPAVLPVVSAPVVLPSSVPVTEGTTNTKISQTVSSSGQGATPPIHQMMWLGVKNNDVKTLQTALANDGLYPKENVTGFYGPVTMSAVQAFQKKYNIVSGGTPETTGFGIVGSKTLAKFNEIYSTVSSDTTKASGVSAGSAQKGYSEMTATGISKAQQIADIKIKIDALVAELSALLSKAQSLKAAASGQ